MDNLFCVKGRIKYGILGTVIIKITSEQTPESLGLQYSFLKRLIILVLKMEMGIYIVNI